MSRHSIEPIRGTAHGEFRRISLPLRPDQITKINWRAGQSGRKVTEELKALIEWALATAPAPKRRA